MKKVILIIISVVVLGVFFYPKEFVKFNGGLLPQRYSERCLGIYQQRYNEVHIDGGIGGVCFGYVFQIENPKGPCYQGMTSKNMWCEDGLNLK